MKVICPVCERDWIFDGNNRPTKKINEREVKSKRGKKDKAKSAISGSA